MYARRRARHKRPLLVSVDRPVGLYKRDGAKFASEWTPDYSIPKRAAMMDVLLRRGGSAALMFDYVMAQVTAGLVSPPDFPSIPVPAQAD